jgi:uroporphyrinogen decarboxylase
LKKITAAAKAAGRPAIFFARDTKTLLPHLAEVGADAYAVDWTVSLTEARKTLGDGAALMGNLKPEILQGKPDAVRAAAVVLLGEAADLGAVIPSLGHGVPPDTPEENVRLFVETVHGYKKERL